MRIILILLMILTTGFAFAAGNVAPAGSTGEARETISRWVDTQRLLSQEQADWREQKAFLEQSISLLRQEIGQLRHQIEAASADLAETGERAKELRAEKEIFLQRADEAAAVVTRIEGDLRGIVAIFPPSLRERMTPLLRRLEAANAAIPLSQRLQTALGLLGEASRFAGSVTLAREVHSVEDGRHVEVNVLYIGFGKAYFTNETGAYAGYGLPGAGGWEWESVPELSPMIARAIAIHENRRPAEFIDLPVRLRNLEITEANR